MTWRRLLFSGAIFLTGAGSAGADGLFLDLDLKRFPVEHPPSALRLDDFNRDARPDVAVAHPGNAGVSVLLQEVDGSLGTPVLHGTGLSPVHLTSGDLNGDGAPDLATVNSGSATLSVFTNRGNGTFPAARTVELSDDPRAAEFADVDRDGALDLIATTNHRTASNPGFFTLFRGDGTGGLQESGRFNIGDNPHYLVIADFEGDGLLDVAINHTLAVSWFRGRGDGTFEDPVRTDLSPTIPRFIAGGDFNRDGRLDLATVTDTPDLVNLEGQAGGVFSLRPIPTALKPGLPVAVKDFDADGTLDLIAHLHTGTSSTLQFLRGAGDGSFAPLEEITFEHSLADYSMVDFDGDSVLDVVASKSSPHGVVVVQGAGPGRIHAGEVLRLESPPLTLLAVDANGDARADLLAAAATAVHFLRSRGRDGLAPPVSSAIAGALEDAVAADLDGNGATEVAVADLAGARVLIGRIDAAGRWTAALEHPTGVLPWRLAYADFDGDGFGDLAVADRARTAVAVLLAPAAPGRQSRQVDLDAGSPQTALAAGDLDGDVSADLVVADAMGLQVWRGDGRGGFAAPAAIDALAGGAGLRVADIDSDGSADIVGFHAGREGIMVVQDAASPQARRLEVAPGASGLRAVEIIDADTDGRLDLAAAVTIPFSAIAVWRGLANGSVAATPDLYRAGSDPVAISFADLDEDGRIDLAAADGAESSVVVLKGRADTGPPPQFRRGDINLDGNVNLTDAGLILARLFRGGAPFACEDASDADDDGRLGLTDAIFILIHRYLGGPAPPDPGSTHCGEDPTEDSLFPCNENCF